MVYKKYIKRGNKLHGPYYYESYRDENGKTKSRYLKDYKSPHKKIFPFIFLGILIIFGIILSLYFNSSDAEIINSISNIISPLLRITGFVSFNPLDDRTIGYEYLDNLGDIVNESEATVVHMWNSQDDYFFNKSSGIQFSNHFQEYWTHNIFCGGYKNATGNWVYKCNDALPFNWNIKTDNLTYVNYTGWRDISIGTKKVRTAIRYHLKTNDKNITIQLSINNTGEENITTDLGFAWRVNNIQVNNDSEGDRLFINNTDYWLNETLDLGFTELGNETFYKIYDKAFIRLDWNKNLNYKVKVQNKTGQDNAPITLGINVGTLSIGQEKHTTMFWRDPPGRLYDVNLQIGNSNINVGEFTTLNFSEMYTTNDPNDYTIMLEDTPGAQGNQILTTCSGLDIKVLNITFDGQMATYCSDNGATYTCTNLPGGVNPVGNAIWTVEGCTEGTATYGQDESYTGAIEGEITVSIPDTTAPKWFDNSTNSTLAGTYIEHRIRWTDIGLSGYIFSFDNGTGSFTNDSFVEMTGTQNWSNVTKYVNETIGSTIRWRVYANDTASPSNWNQTDIFTYNTTAPDTTYPQFSDYWDDNASLEGNGTGHFNVTVTNTNGTVLLEINNTNITATNYSSASSIFNASHYFSTNGTYAYRWHSWGNGSEEKYNVSDTRNYTVNISYGTLDINITLPLNNSVYYQNETDLIINATITCQGTSNAKCGTVSALVRYNLTASPDTAINTTEGASPFYILSSQNPQESPETLEQGESWNVSWQLNVTTSSIENYLIDVNFTSSYGNSIVPDNNTEDRLIVLNKYGTLNVNITSPINNSNFSQGDTNLTINATVTCQGGTNAKCGTVSALARYNLTASPDTAINITSGAFPFYITKTWHKTLGETVFNPASTDYISVTTIDNDSIAIAYKDTGAGSNGTFVVYNINGSVELNETVFNPASTDHISVTTIDNDSIAIAYKDTGAGSNGTFVVYNINGTVELNETVFNSPTALYISATTIDNDSIAITYEDSTGNGSFVVYNINGSVETDEVVFNDIPYTYYVSATTIDNDSIAISYRDSGEGNNGTFVVYNINGSVELDETVFNLGVADYISVTTIDNDSIAIAYYDIAGSANDGTFVVYNINGSVELDKTIFNLGGSPYISAATIDNNSVAITYEDLGAGGNGTFIVYNINGSVELNETVFNPAITGYTSIIKTDNNSVAIAYGDSGTGTGNFVVYSLIAKNPEISSEILEGFSLETLESGESWNVLWTLNITSSSIESYLIDVLFNSSYGDALVPDNDTEDRQVNLNPSVGDETPPDVDLVSPINYQNLSDSSVNFNCSMTDTGDGLKNSTLYGNWSGWHANETQIITGSSNSTNFTKILSDGIYVWNCYVCDQADNCAFDSANYTFTIDTNPPTINLVAPANNSIWNSSSIVSFTYNVSDASFIENCSLILNGTINQTNSSITKDTNQTFNQTLVDGNYNWSINCTDIVNNLGASSIYNLTVNVSIAYSIDLSPKLGQQINWTLTSLPTYNQSAEGNNNTGITEYYVNISAEGTTVDLYVKANDDLKTSGLDVLGLGNETYSYNITNASVPSMNKFSLTTNYADNKIGENLNNGDVVYLKFFLSAPSGQPAGTYNNTLLFKSVPN